MFDGVAPLLEAGALGGNGVAVDGQCRTSLADVYAIGDCALHRNAFAGDAEVRLESVQNAADQAAVAAQAILTFDDRLQTPRDMADVPVVVQELTGSHYTTLQMLESAIGREHVNIVNGGLPQFRWAGLKDGTYRAVTVMEPFISLGLKEGAHFVACSFYRGGEVVAAELTPEQRKAYYDAENEAVDLINADFYKYAHHVAAHAKGALKPHELLRTFVHYKHVDYYDPALLGRAYDWMKARGLTEGQSQHGALVVG